MRREYFVLPAPAISQQLGLGSRGEQLGIEKLIPRSSIERFNKPVRPWGSWARCTPCWWGHWPSTSP